MCDKELERILRQDHVEEPSVDASFITKRSFLRFVRDHPHYERIIPPHTRPPVTCQKANLYHAFTEDIHPFSRIARFGSKYHEVENVPPHFPPSEGPFTIQDPYSEEDAVNHYLRSDPPNFVIFGKPGLNNADVTSALVNIWNCILISPASLIRQEIDAVSDKGRHIETALRNGSCLGQEIVMDLIRCRIRTREVRHRGYIAEGLPLIPNDFDYSPRALGDICTEFCEDSGLESCKDQNLLQNSGCKVKINYDREILQQINEIFTTWPRKPLLIIYMVCPKQDVVSKCARRRMEAETGNTVENTIDSSEDRAEQSDDSLDLYQASNERAVITGGRKTHLLKRISDMEHNVKAQCDLYERLALPVIDEWIFAQNPQYIIRVDGRSSAQRILETINTRLCMLPLQRTILPKRMIERHNVHHLEEYSNVNLDEKIIEKPVEEVFGVLMQRETVSSRFPWKLSAWKFYCPVELAQGRTVKGFAKHSVRFLDKIFFLSSKEAEDLFTKNPRTFLLPPNPRPTCKIAIFGPRYAGKSKLGTGLAEVLHGTVINVNELAKGLMKRRIDKKISERICEMRENMMQKMKDDSKTEREIRERMRLIDILSWYTESVEVIDRLVDILEISKFHIDIRGYDKQLEDVRLKLQSLGLAHLEDDRQLMMQIRIDRNLLYDHAPQSLRTEEPSITKLLEDNFNIVQILQDRIKYVYDELIDIPADEKAEIIIRNIKRIADEKLEDGLLRDGGYVIDGMYVDIEIWRKIIDDANIIFEDLILLYEDEPHACLLDKLHSLSGFDSSAYEIDYTDTEIDYEEYGISRQGTEQKYMEHLKHFETDWAYFEEEISKFEGNLIKCNLADIDDVTEYVLNYINRRFSATATVRIESGDEERKVLKEADIVEDVTDVANVEEASEEREKGVKSIRKYSVPSDDRPLGDSNYYCPVALSHHVCLKGKDEYTALFMDKIYLLSSAEALNKFLKDPTKFSVPFSTPKYPVPPLRVAIVGPPGSGKTKISEMVSREYGMAHIDYFDNFTMFIKKRTMKPFTPTRDLLTSADDDDEVVELPIDLHDEKYNSHEPTVRSFVRWYWKTGGELPSKMLQECLLTFYKPPYDRCGIMLDGFPSCPEDVEAAIENYTMPELIIELRCSLQTSLDRILPILFAAWKERLEDERKRTEEERGDRYLRKREYWIERYGEVDEDTELENGPMHRTMQYDDDETRANLKRYYYDETNDRAELWHFEENLQATEEFTVREDWETSKELIVQRIAMLYENGVQKLLSTRNALKGISIPWIEIDAEDTEKVVSLRILSLLDAFAFRDSSMFERTYTIDLECAERLLDCGYYFLSSFGRWCPVQVYNKTTPIQMFLPMKARGEIFPVVHRRYIYFLTGKEALSAFLRDPLRYLAQDTNLPLLPLRISIIGPPKCGKTTLANRFAKMYGMKVIAPGEALRHMLRNCSWTESARMTEDQLRTGQTASIDSITRAIEMSSIGPRAISQGYVLDDCPSGHRESERLALLGIQPMIVLELKADLRFCLECYSRDSDETKTPPNVPATFVSRRFANWQACRANFRDWLTKFSRNVIELDATRSKWNVWTRADHAVRSRVADIALYFREADFDKVHRLKYMCVSPFEFRVRQSRYRSRCPVCLFRTSKVPDQPTDDQEMVQFREYFYWICSQHMHAFVQNPLRYLTSVEIMPVADERPRIIHETVDVEHACWAQCLRVDGLCLVTYVDGLPDRKLTRGKVNLAVLLKDNVYLFCSEKCREKFLVEPDRYSQFDIKFPRELSPIEMRSLPDLGYLEQTVAKIIVKAVDRIAVYRPKIVGLSASVSAAIYIGIHLKIHDISEDPKAVDAYKAASKRMAKQDRIVKMVTDTVKKKLNPYVSLPRDY